MGLLLYRLLLVNAVVINVLDVLVAALRRACKWPGQHDAAMVRAPTTGMLFLGIYRMRWQVMVQAIETQAVVWLGCFSAPLLPLMGLVNNTVSFEVHARRMWSRCLHHPTQYNTLPGQALACMGPVRTTRCPLLCQPNVDCWLWPHAARPAALLLHGRLSTAVGAAALRPVGGGTERRAGVCRRTARQASVRQHCIASSCCAPCRRTVSCSRWCAGCWSLLCWWAWPRCWAPARCLAGPALPATCARTAVWLWNCSATGGKCKPRWWSPVVRRRAWGAAKHRKLVDLHPKLCCGGIDKTRCMVRSRVTNAAHEGMQHHQQHLCHQGGS